jgi:4-aminobutyrate aminotransferase-like enzyme
MTTAPRRDILDMNAYRGGAAPEGLLARRMANFGAASVLFYDRPLQIVSASGSWMQAAEGTRYLDCYNNVPSVGHCHPGVVAAVARQVGELNVNSRYLHKGVETYVERLRETFPGAPRNAVLCCSGSEANDLAIRVCMKATGRRGFIVTDAAYHGNTLAVTEISPSSWKRGAPPDHVRLVPAPSTENYGADIAGGLAAAVTQAAAQLDAGGHGAAGFFCDSIFSSDGVYADPPGFLAPAVEAARAAGALYVADEVQPGFGRTGAGMWGYLRHGVEPDIITMGKPMGNGFPMAGMILRPELLDRFCQDTGYFNTFGANPVAAAAGLAVLDAIRDQDLISAAARTGARLLSGLRALPDRGLVAEVRGAGLFLGVQMDAPARASAMIAGLRERRVLIGAAGLHGETLKIRPPLTLSDAEADMFLDAFVSALAAL